MSRGGIARAENLFDFFHASVETAAARQRAPLSPEGIYYLSQLLVERGREPERSDPGTLTELYAQAAQGGAATRIQATRELGDRALYTTGFFRPSLSRRLVSVDFYMQMGAAAYRRLASLLRGPPSPGRGMDEIYAELGAHFAEASDLLQEVREDVSEPGTDADVLRLYEQWLTTGSPRAAAKLRERGIVPGRARGSEDDPVM